MIIEQAPVPIGSVSLVALIQDALLKGLPIVDNLRVPQTGQTLPAHAGQLPRRHRKSGRCWGTAPSGWPRCA